MESQQITGKNGQIYQNEEEKQNEQIDSVQNEQKSLSDKELQMKKKQGMKKRQELKQKAQEMGISQSKLKKMLRKQKWQQEKLQKRRQKKQKEKEKKRIFKLENKLQQGLQSNNLTLMKENFQSQTCKLNHYPVQYKQYEKKTINQDIQNQKIHYEETQGQMKKRKDQYQQKMKDNLKVVIDLQFYDLMTQKQINSLVKQLSYCHSINRKMIKPFNYILTSLTEQRAQFLDSKYNGKKWGINLLEQSIDLAFNINDLIYLTGDAQEQIQDFDQSKIYIIGGIVDHNRLKKITYNYAKQKQIQVKRLPMKNIKLKSNVHLAVNHVWEWMLRKYNGQTWNQSIEKVIPERKIQKEQKQ